MHEYTLILKITEEHISTNKNNTMRYVSIQSTLHKHELLICENFILLSKKLFFKKTLYSLLYELSHYNYTIKTITFEE